jgi:hypothetical protein
VVIERSAPFFCRLNGEETLMNRLKHTCRNGHNSTGRSTDGRFTVGCPGGPGRPARSAERDYLLALSKACPLEKWQAICRRAVRDAEKGDSKARDWLARYLLGSPADLPTLMALGLEEEERT